MVSVDQLAEEDKTWMLTTFPKFRGLVLRGVNLDAYEKAEFLMTGERTVPDCSCSYNSYQIKINALYEKWVGQNT